jgi:single-strand DNA-binding protein
MSLNRVQLIGNLGKDPETRYTPSGKKVTHFSLAVNRRWKGEDGEFKEATDWVNIEAWGRVGERCQESLSKGSRVFIEGRLQIDRVEQGGEVRYYTQVVALMMQIIERRAEEKPAEEEEEFPFG